MAHSTNVKTPYECYKLYVSLLTHFTSEKYSFFENHPHRVTLKSYEKRRDKWVFEKLCRHRDLTGLIVANLITEEKIWPEFLIREEAQRNYVERTKRIDSLTYTFTEDLKELLPDFDSNIKIQNNVITPLLRFLIRGNICIETVCIIVDVSNCFGHWTKQLEGDVLWEGLRLKIMKYQPFLMYDKDTYRKLIVSTFNDRMDRGTTESQPREVC